MKNTKTSKQVKHEHAVVVCSIIGRKGSDPYPIKDKNGHILNFIDIRDTFLSEEHLIISKKEKTLFFKISKDEYDIWKKSIEKKASQTLDEWELDESEYVSKCDVLGEYDWEHKRVFLYTKNIENLCNKSNNKTDKNDEKKYIVETYIHELFHAFFHKVTLQGNNNYNYIQEIEEALTEFCVLWFLEKTNDPFYIRLKGFFDFDKDEMSTFALQDIRNKQNAVGVLAAYGFGAYLFENLEEKEQYKLINNYIQRLGYIDKDDDKVKEYCEKVRLSGFVPGNQEHCLELLKEILKPTSK